MSCLFGVSQTPTYHVTSIPWHTQIDDECVGLSVLPAGVVPVQMLHIFTAEIYYDGLLTSSCVLEFAYLPGFGSNESIGVVLSLHLGDMGRGNVQHFGTTII